MYPPHEIAFYMWMTIIGAVSVAVIVGALIDRYIFNRHAVRLRVESGKSRCGRLKHENYRG